MAADVDFNRKFLWKMEMLQNTIQERMNPHWQNKISDAYA
jgi:hypothetical protein